MSTSDRIRGIRFLARQNNIYTLAALDTFMSIKDGMCQAEVMKLTRQGTGAISAWMNIFIFNGLVEIADAPIGQRKAITLTEAGNALQFEIAKMAGIG